MNKEYHVGFAVRKRGEMHKQVCSLVIKGKCGMLVGPEDALLFAVDAITGLSFPISIVEYSARWELAEYIPLP